LIREQRVTHRDGAGRLDLAGNDGPSLVSIKPEDDDGEIER